MYRQQYSMNWQWADELIVDFFAGGGGMSTAMHLANYIITHGHDGRRFSKTAQVRMCGNSVSPPPAIALIKANYQYQPTFAEAI